MNRSAGRFLFQSYEFFSRFLLTRRYIAGLYERFMIYAPGDKKSLVKKTMECAFIIWAAQAAAVFLLLSAYPGIYGAALSLLAVFILSDEMISRQSQKAGILLLEQLDTFLSDVRHHYYNYRMVEESVADAAEASGDIMKLQAERIHQVLISQDIAEELSKYNDEVTDRFLRMFLALCVTVLEYGDKEVDGQLLFLNNIKYLKQEIAVELLKRKELKYRFAGLIWVAVLPVFFLRVIEGWAVGNLPELASFYRGAPGMLLAAAVYGMTWVIDIMLGQLKERETGGRREYKGIRTILKINWVGALIDHFVRRNYGRCIITEGLLRKVGDKRSIREFELGRFLAAAAVTCVCVCLFFGIHQEERRQALTFTYAGEAAAGLNQTVLLKLEEVYPGLVLRYARSQITEEGLQEIRRELLNQGIFANEAAAVRPSESIAKNARSYRNAVFHWYELLACFAAGAAAYLAGYGLLKYRSRILRMDMEDEVVQFQSIVLMMMYMDRMSVPSILEMMENFAAVFLPQIQKCMNNYNYGDEPALLELKEECGFEPMRRLADQFLLCDRIGIVRAFDEIAVERANFREKRKLDNEMNLSKKSAIGKLISYLPMAFSIGGYLIIPFVSASLSELMRYAAEMNAM